MMNETERQVTELVAKQIAADRPGVVLTSETRLIEDDIIDSLGIILLVDMLQERFDVEVEVQDVVADNFATVRAIADLVDRTRAGTSS